MQINVLQNSKLNIVCPNPASVLDEQDESIPQEQMYENMWIVDKHEYDTCTVNTSVPSFSANKKLLSCNSPLKLKYYPLVFRAFSATRGLEFASGTKYYFIGKYVSSKFAGTHLYTWVRERHCESKVSCPAQTRTARSGVQYTNHLAIAHPIPDKSPCILPLLSLTS